MKVEHTKILELLQIIEFKLDGIIDAVRCGDDGHIYSCISMRDELTEEIKLWKAINMAKQIEKESISEKYIRYQKVSEKQNIGLNLAESQELIKSNLYFWLKRQIKNDDNIGNINVKNLSNYLQGYIENDSKMNNDMYFGTYIYSTFEVLKDVEEEIIEIRKKNPQTKLL